MSREDWTDVGLLAIAISCIAAIVLLVRDYLKPLPLHKRILVRARLAAGR